MYCYTSENNFTVYGHQFYKLMQTTKISIALLVQKAPLMHIFFSKLITECMSTYLQSSQPRDTLLTCSVTRLLLNWNSSSWVYTEGVNMATIFFLMSSSPDKTVNRGEHETYQGPTTLMVKIGTHNTNGENRDPQH